MLACVPLAFACGGDDGARPGGDGDGGVLTVTASATGTSTGDGMTGGGTAGGSGSVVDGTADDDGGLPVWDVGAPDGGAACGGGSGSGDGTLSYIWIANSPESTVSKINTQTMIEEGRYIVRADSAGNPSRTSVSLSGDVGVANRFGGVTKIYGNTDDCQESNGVPGIQTSSGGADILPWGTEECVAWHTPLAYTSNRPMAWAQGDFDQASCSYVNEKLWTGGANGGGTTQVLLLDGETGVVEQTVDLPEIQSSIGLYGGAVDGDGNFWGIETGGVRLVRVDRNNFTTQVWAGPGASYGIAVDSVGRPWFCAGGGADRFDPVTQTWQSLPSPGGNQWGGCMTDGAGTLWHCRHSDSTLVGIDTETLQVVQQIPIPSYAHGISVDFDGNVWAVGFGSSVAYRVDPVTGTIDTFNNLVGAYTYSDMTGFALSTAGTPSG
ncbi:MAG: hypothetical protein AAGF11_49090 [Myxococcota bacterium]